MDVRLLFPLSLYLALYTPTLRCCPLPLRLMVVLLRLFLEVQLQSIPLNSNRQSLQHTINSQPRFRT
jgi:hypothetical protein